MIYFILKLIGSALIIIIIIISIVVTGVCGAVVAAYRRPQRPLFLPHILQSSCDVFVSS